MNIQDVVRGLVQKDSGQAREIFTKASQQTRDIFHSVVSPHVQPIKTGVSLLDNAIGKGIKNPSTQSIVQNFMKQASPSLIQKTDDMAAKLDPKRGLDLNRVKRQVLESPKVSPQTKGMVSRLRMSERELKEKKPLNEKVYGIDTDAIGQPFRNERQKEQWQSQKKLEAETSAKLRTTMGKWGDYIVATADEIYSAFEKEAARKEEKIKQREQSKVNYREAILKFRDGEGPLPKWEDYNDALLKPTIGELTAPMRERAYGGIITDPLFFGGQALKDFSEGRQVWGAANTAIAAGTIHPLGWLVTGAFNQKGVRKKVEELTTKWTEWGDKVKGLPGAKQLSEIHPEVNDAMDVTWQFIPYILGAKIAKGAVKKNVPGVKIQPGGELKMTNFPKNRAWVDALARESEIFFEALEKDPEAAFGELLSNADDIRQAKIMALTVADEAPVASFKGQSKKPEELEVGKVYDVNTFDIDAYVERRISEREAARGKTTRTAPEFVRDVTFTAKQYLVDSNAPVVDWLAQMSKENKFSILPEYRLNDNLIDRVYRSPDIAGAYLRQWGMEQMIVDVARVAENSLDTFGEYLIDRYVPEYEKRNGPGSSGRDVTESRVHVEKVERDFPIFKEFAEVFDRAHHKLLDILVMAGDFSPDTAHYFKTEFKDFAQFDRVMSEAELEGKPVGGKGGGVGAPKQSGIVKKAKGSDRPIEHPLASFLDRLHSAVLQANKNQVALQVRNISKLPGSEGLIKPILTADMVKKRIDLFGQAKELKPVQDRIEGFVKRHKKDFTQLMREMAKLQKEGETTASRLVKEMVKPETLRKWEKGKKTLPSNVLDFTKEKRFQDAINDLMAKPPYRLRQLAEMIYRRGEKAKEIADELVGLQEAAQSVKVKRAELIAEGRALRPDKVDPERGTINPRVDGITEIWEVPKWLETTMKHMEPQQFNILGQIWSWWVYRFKEGTTTFSPAFILANAPKDLGSAFTNIVGGAEADLINPVKGAKVAGEAIRSAMNPYLMPRAILDAFGKGELFDQVVSDAGISTKFDVGRQAAQKTLDSIASNASRKSRIKYLIKNPGDFWKSVEDIASVPEIGVRMQVYEASYNAYRKMGMNHERARIMAGAEARNATANFLRRGAWGQTMNMLFPYTNAGIQGTRAFIRATERDPVRTMTKLITSVGMPLAVTTIWNLSSKERAAAYMELQEYEFENSIILLPENPVPDEDGNYEASIKIPLPPGMSSMMQPIRKVIEAIAAEEPTSIGEMARYVFSAFSPVDIQSSNAFLSTATPPLLRGPLEVFTNKQFFTGAPIVPDNMRARLEKEAETTQAAKLLARVSGMSPLQTEHLIKSYFGNSSENYLNMTDKTMAMLGIIEDDEVGGESFGEAIRKRFKTVRGGRSEQRKFDILGAFADLQDFKRADLDMQADHVIDQVIAAESPKDKQKILDEALAANPKLAEKIQNNLEDRARGLTAAERYTKTLNVKNGFRPVYIYHFLLEDLSPEEKLFEIQKLKSKGVATDSVMKQLMQLHFQAMQNPEDAAQLKQTFEAQLDLPED